LFEYKEKARCIHQSLVVRPLAPFEYTSLLWATTIGYLVWQDIPTRQVWIGASIIIACGLYVVHRESLRHRGLEIERKVTRL
jgi:drug/metabolite transporter (DMT)-like permease